MADESITFYNSVDDAILDIRKRSSTPSIFHESEIHKYKVTVYSTLYLGCVFVFSFTLLHPSARKYKICYVRNGQTHILCNVFASVHAARRKAQKIERDWDRSSIMSIDEYLLSYAHVQL